MNELHDRVQLATDFFRFIQIVSNAALGTDGVPDAPIIILITGYSAVRTGVEAMKIGAFDYTAKAFMPDEVEASVAKGLRQRRLLTDHPHLKRALQ